MTRFQCVILLFILSLFIVYPANAIPLPDSVDKAIAQVQDTAAAVKNFSILMYDIISFFSRLFGFSALLLLTAVILTASGLVSIGVPAGRTAFFSALVFWDTLWVIWLFSAGTLNIESFFSFTLINAKVTAPFAAFDIGRMSIRFFLRRIRIRNIRRKGFSSLDYIGASKRISKAHAAVQDALLAGAAQKKDYMKDPAALDTINKLQNICSSILAEAQNDDSRESAVPTNESLSE